MTQPKEYSSAPIAIGIASVILVSAASGWFLFKGDASAHAGGSDDVAPLQLAKLTSPSVTAVGHNDIVQLLIDSGAIIDITDAVELAAGNGHLSTVELLLDNGATATDEALIAAAENGEQGGSQCGHADAAAEKDQVATLPVVEGKSVAVGAAESDDGADVEVA